MATSTTVPTDRKIEVPLGTYSISYSPRLVRSIDHLPEGYASAEYDKSDFYDALKVAAVMGVSLPTAGEEHAIYAQRGAGAKKLRDVEEFRDHFTNNDEKVYIWGHSLTGLRFREKDLRKPYNVGDKVTVQVIETDITPFLPQIANPEFTRNNWKDIIGQVNHVKDELIIPYCRGQVIREMHPVHGIFTEVEPSIEHNAPSALHGWLRENLDLPQDPISGYYDVAVERRSCWHHDVGERCLNVYADYRRLNASSNAGFRPVVRGSRLKGPKIEVVSADVDIEKIRQELMSQVASDLRKLPSPELLEKYKL
jgi:hypothetical protein